MLYSGHADIVFTLHAGYVSYYICADHVNLHELYLHAMMLFLIQAMQTDIIHITLLGHADSHQLCRPCRVPMLLHV